MYTTRQVPPQYSYCTRMLPARAEPPCHTPISLLLFLFFPFFPLSPSRLSRPTIIFFPILRPHCYHRLASTPQISHSRPHTLHPRPPFLLLLFLLHHHHHHNLHHNHHHHHRPPPFSLPLAHTPTLRIQLSPPLPSRRAPRNAPRLRPSAPRLTRLTRPAPSSTPVSDTSPARLRPSAHRSRLHASLPRHRLMGYPHSHLHPQLRLPLPHPTQDHIIPILTLSHPTPFTSSILSPSFLLVLQSIHQAIYQAIYQSIYRPIHFHHHLPIPIPILSSSHPYYTPYSYFIIHQHPSRTPTTTSSPTTQTPPASRHRCLRHRLARRPSR